MSSKQGEVTVWRGWVNNYRLANIHGKLKKLDEWLRNRLRNCIWHDWKKSERKRKNLIRMGIDQGPRLRVEGLSVKKTSGGSF
ncbi:MAG: group II intron maturase-specific domain-containing protein [Owenweeksia sp.]|nr:group II intron maturase-specific domain-containing protein [Owenweeksia sp.]